MLQISNIRRSEGFSLVELLVVMAMMGILSAIWIVSYSASLSGAWDAARMTDMEHLKIILRSEKQKTGAYPRPGSVFTIVNSWAPNAVAFQGFMNPDVAMNELTEYPKDPITKGHYPYSTSKNRQSFQIATIVWDSDPVKAYVGGDYKTVAKNVLPSLMLAMTWAVGTNVEIADGVTTDGSVGSNNRKRFILNGWTANLPYDKKGVPQGNDTLSFSEILSQSWVVATWTSRFRSCGEIVDGGVYIWPWQYQTLASDGSVQDVVCP